MKGTGPPRLGTEWGVMGLPLKTEHHRTTGVPSIYITTMSGQTKLDVGSVAILPLDSATANAGINVFQASLSKIPGIDLQVGPDAVNESTRAIIWLDNSANNLQMLSDILDRFPKISWIQLPMAGINAYADLVRKHSSKTWTSAKVSL